MAESRLRESARILLTCDASPLGEAALDAAVALARQLDSELAGLFVENVNLLRMAALPFASEVGLSGARTRRVDTGELERSLRQQAQQVRDALSRAAQTLRVPWSFQVVRGSMLESVLDAMRDADLAVFGYAGQYAAPAGARAGTEGASSRVAPGNRPILVIYDDTPAAERALIAANVLARVHRTGVFILLIAPDAAAAQRMRSHAIAQLDGVPVHFQSFRMRDVPTIRKAAETHCAAALLWHGTTSEADRKMLAALVDGLKCPVVLVS